jgi:proline iminopeptidase
MRKKLFAFLLSSFSLFADQGKIIEANGIGRSMKSDGVVGSRDFQLGYCIEGSGPNTLVIGSSIYYPRLFSENLRHHLRLIFADMRAFAPAPRSEMPLNFDLNLLLDDIECIRSELNLGKVIIVGHSGNAFLALEYAKKYPENVSHVLMVAISEDLSDRTKKSADEYWEKTASAERKEAQKKWLAKFPDSQEEQIPFKNRFIWNYIRHTPRIWYDFNFDPSSLWKDVKVNMPIFEYVWGTLYRDIDITKGLATLKAPVFLALGRHDFIMAPPDSWTLLKPKFKDLSIFIFDKSGHPPCYEQPELFDATLLKWLASHE